MLKRSASVHHLISCDTRMYLYKIRRLINLLGVSILRRTSSSDGGSDFAASIVGNVACLWRIASMQAIGSSRQLKDHLSANAQPRGGMDERTQIVARIACLRCTRCHCIEKWPAQARIARVRITMSFCSRLIPTAGL